MKWVLVMAVVALGAPTWAQTTDDPEAEKLAQCTLSADLMSAVQKARLDRVRKAKAADAVLAARPDWPSAVSGALPTLVDYVYGLPRKDVRDTDLGASIKAQCLQQFDAARELTGTPSN